MSNLVPILAPVMAAVLLWAGLEKARMPSSFVAVLRQLGLSERTAPVAAGLVVALELSVGFGLIFRPHSLLTQVGVVSLAAAFAWSGFIALRRNARIRCGCFGLHSHSHLGADQLAAFPFWFGGVALLGSNEPTYFFDLQGTSVFAIVALTIAALRGVGALRAAREARDDRRSARRMLVWMNR